MSGGKDIKDSNDSNEDKSELYEQLEVLKLAEKTTYLVVFVVLLNIKNIRNQEMSILDAINNTNFAEDLQEMKYMKKQGNTILRFASGIFLYMNYFYFANRDLVESGEEEENILYQNFISSLLIFIATVMAGNNIEL